MSDRMLSQVQFSDAEWDLIGEKRIDRALLDAGEIIAQIVHDRIAAAAEFIGGDL